jgi:hypothetical protein
MKKIVVPTDPRAAMPDRRPIARNQLAQVTAGRNRSIVIIDNDGETEVAR